MQHCLRWDGDIFENAPRVYADIFIQMKKDVFSKISEYAWTGPMSMLCSILFLREHKYEK